MSEAFIGAGAALAARLGDAALSNELSVLAERIAGPSEAAELSSVAASLETILGRCDLIFPELDEEDRNSYVEGNLLLLECLAQAAVADREAIKARLLLLPPEEG